MERLVCHENQISELDLSLCVPERLECDDTVSLTGVSDKTDVSLYCTGEIDYNNYEF